ncbi:MAG: hypothetical protein IT342_13485 [Candidatus Melainabacteria bacterium]|nr:hypothetical protein [Candidatus Melainabacteria bacterium]
MDTAKSSSDQVTLFIGTYGYGVTQDFVAKRSEHLRDSFRAIFFDNPFIQIAGAPSGFVMGYEDWAHARHVTNLNGCKRHLIALLKVELDADALERLQAEGAIKNVAASPKQIWQVIAAKLLKVPDAQVTFTVLAPTAFPAVSLDGFELPEALLSELKAARTDCMQSLFVSMAAYGKNYKKLLAAHQVDFDELFARLGARARELPAEERERLVELV